MKVILVQFDDYNTTPDFVAVNDEDCYEALERLKEADPGENFKIELLTGSMTLDEAVDYIADVNKEE